jgi:hypothetical protein
MYVRLGIRSLFGALCAVIEPGATPTAVYWSRRIPAALTFLYGEPGGVH